MRFKITESHRDDDGTLVIDAIEPDEFPLAAPDTITITINRAWAERYISEAWMGSQTAPEHIKDLIRSELGRER